MRTWTRLLAAGAVWLVGVTAASLAVTHAQATQRHELLDRFDGEAVTGARFVSAYVDDVFAREQRLAAGLGTGVDGPRFASTTRMSGFQAAVLLDGRGRVVATSPPDPALRGTLLAPAYAHLSAALAGRRAVSGVVLSAVRHEPVVGFALPLRAGPRPSAPGGVLSGGFSLQRSPLKTFLARVSVGGRGYVVDAVGQVAAYAGPGATADLGDVVVSRAVRHPYLAAGRVAAAAPIAGTPWTLVTTAPADAVLDPVTQDDRTWWGLLVAGAAAALLGLVLTVVVVEAREKARAQRAEAQRRFQLTFEHAPIGMTMLSLDHRLVQPNRQLCQMLGYGVETLQTKTVQDITHPDDISVDEEQLQRLLTGEIDHHERDKRYLTADGSVLWARLTVSLVRDTAGRPLHFVGQVQDVTEMRAAQQELQRMAMYDSLTGLPNRSLLHRELTRLLHPQRRESHTAVAFCDLDRFKAVNDSLGHQVGDRLLAVIGHRLQRTVRSGDTVARWGGDEFVLLMVGVESPAEAEAVLERTRRVVERPVRVAGHTVRVGISVGLTIAHRGDDVATVLREADRALYVAKDRARSSGGLQGVVHCQPTAPAGVVGSEA